MLNWIRAFLTNRKQKVSVNGVLSPPRPVVSGVPQGSVLDPVLFLLFINDISNSIRSNLRLFADDCVLYKEVATQQDCQFSNKTFIFYLIGQRLGSFLFNVSKCYHLGITRKKIPIEFNYSLDGKFITRASSTTCPGIFITNNLSWNEHCDIICKKANSTLGLLRRILSGCAPK